MSNKVLFIMGVSGSGKSTIGKLLSEALKIPFFDGDDFHTRENIIKMSSGKPLTDEDRLGWLSRLNSLAKSQLNKGSCVIVCSALKKMYRKILSREIENQTEWIHLRGTPPVILARLKKRADHFMPLGLLNSQFESLESPQGAIEIDISLNPNDIVDLIIEALSVKNINLKFKS